MMIVIVTDETMRGTPMQAIGAADIVIHKDKVIKNRFGGV